MTTREGAPASFGEAPIRVTANSWAPQWAWASRLQRSETAQVLRPEPGLSLANSHRRGILELPSRSRHLAQVSARASAA